jgi:hypothetical protein
VQCRRIWFETTSDLVAMGTAIQGKYITFADGGMSTIAAANAVLEPGTIGMYKLWITGTNETQGGGKIGVARRLPAEEIWWEQRLKTMVDVSCVGVLELAYGVRDPDLDTVPESVRYCLERYKCRISGATSKAAYGNMPFFAYDMAVELSDYDETTSEDTTVSTVDNVLASDRTYSDKMQVSWDDVDLADRYQVYVRTTETAPSGAELIAEQVTFTTPNVLVEVAAGELYCIEIQGGNYTYGTPKYYRGDGLVVSNVIQNTDPYLGNLPAAGAADTTRAYCRNRVMDGDETAAETAFKALVVSGRRFYIWVRARVERNGETDEWTALSTMATGLIRNI